MKGILKKIAVAITALSLTASQLPVVGLSVFAEDTNTLPNPKIEEKQGVADDGTATFTYNVTVDGHADDDCFVYAALYNNIGNLIGVKREQLGEDITIADKAVKDVNFFVFTPELKPIATRTSKAVNTPQFQIVYTNDIHGYYTKTSKGVLGFSALKNIVDKVGADLVLDSGDTFHGQAFATVEEGKSIAELMKEVGYDAMTPGNHDWSYGADKLKELEEIGGFEILASNVVTTGDEDYFENNYLIKDVTADDGTQLKVGVVGVIDDVFYKSTAADNVKDVKFNEEAQEASETAEYLKDTENCDIVVAITHQSDCENFVKNIKDVDVVLAGHEHLVFDKEYKDSEDKTVHVAEAGCNFGNIGVMEITVSPETKEIVDISTNAYSASTIYNVKEDADVKSKIDEIEKRQEGILNETIGYTDTAFPYSWEDIRVAPAKIGKFVTDSYLARTGADVAFENAGGIRGGIDEGDITYKEIISISPYGNVLTTKTLSGKDIIDVLEKSTKLGIECDNIYSLQKDAVDKGEDPYQYSWPKDSGSYLQYSGIEITTDEDGNVTSAKINGEDVQETKEYTVATNNYTADSKYYDQLKNAPAGKDYGTCEQAIREYVVKNYPNK